MTQTITAIQVEIETEIRNEAGQLVDRRVAKIAIFEAAIPPALMEWVVAQMKRGQ